MINPVNRATYESEYEEKIEEYRDAVRLCDFYSHRICMMNLQAQILALTSVVLNKNIVSMDEYMDLVKESKDELLDEEDIIQNYNEADSKRKHLEQEIEEMFKELKKYSFENLFGDIFGNKE